MSFFYLIMIANIFINKIELRNQEIKYSITKNGEITFNQNYFNIPIKIQGQNFSPSNSYKLIIKNLNNNLNIETLDIQFVNSNYLSTVLIVPKGEQNNFLNLIFSLYENNEMLTDNIPFNIQLPQTSSKDKLSVPAIIGIIVGVVVVIGLITWIIYLVKKQKKINKHNIF